MATSSWYVTVAGRAGRSPELVNLVDLLRFRAADQPERVAYTFLVDGETAEAHLTYAELDRRARMLASELAHRGYTGARALVVFEPGLDYIAAFLGALYAGVVAVPVYPPDPLRAGRTLARLRSIVRDAQARVLLSNHAILDWAESLFARVPELETILAVDEIEPVRAAEWDPPELTSDSVAFLQYTSGSTGAPKGVMVSHGNLLHNLQQLHRLDGPHPVGVAWLPPYHDMGLIGGVLWPLYSGGRIILMSPLSFAQRPARWLQAISRYRAQTSASPNFGYELCVRKVSAAEKAQLDLSSWTLAINGAEPVRADTLVRFAEAFAPCGFRPSAFYPSYGLAEATLLVTGAAKHRPPVIRGFCPERLERDGLAVPREPSQGGRELVSCGRPARDQRVAIVDPQRRIELSPGTVGEIWVSGASVALGYWNRAEETRAVFEAVLSDTGDGPFLRTGDLGFVLDGQLFVTGRLKDLIIVAGRNYYPQDIERTVERCHPALKQDGGAAFSIEHAGEERLVIVHEVQRPKKVDLAELAAAIEQQVLAEHDLRPHSVVLIAAGTLPKTSSGKTQRALCRDQYRAGTLSVLFERRNAASLVSPAERPTAPETRLEARVAHVWCEVLGVEQVGRQESFFDLGGHSLLATQLVSRLRSELDLDVPLRALFEQPTVAGLAAWIEARQADTPNGHVPSTAGTANTPGTGDTAAASGTGEASSTHAAAEPPLLHVERSGPQPLSFAQQRLWFLAQLEPENPFYNLPTAVRLVGPLDKAALRLGLTQLVERHESLRTVFQSLDGVPHQVVLPQIDVQWQEADLSHVPAAEREAALHELLAAEARRPFDLQRGPLVRALLVRLSSGEGQAPAEHVLELVLHHIVGDGWSLGVMASELAELYEAALAGRAAALVPLAIQYVDFACWQQAWLQGRKLERELAWWQEHLQPLPPPLELPSDRPRPAAPSFRGGLVRLAWDEELSGQVRSFSRQAGVTPFMTLLAAYQAWLSRLSGEQELCVGVPIANRTRQELEGLVGFLANTLVLRGDLRGQPSFAEVVSRVREETLGAYAHQHLPFEKLVEALNPERGRHSSPLFRVAMVMQNAPLELRAGGSLRVVPELVDNGTAKYDLTLFVWETPTGWEAGLEYAADLFERSTVEAWGESLLALLRGALAAPHESIGALPVHSQRQLRQLAEWNATGREYPQQAVHELVSAAAACYADAIAVADEGGELSYAELEAASNRLAWYLREQGVERETPVGICLGRSRQLVVGLLGILKAGGAYVPLDPSYPRARLDYMVQDAGVRLIVSDRGSVASLPDCAVPVVCLEEAAAEIAAQPASHLPSGSVPGDLAYIIYTSGSTGRPKGVEIEHGGLVNHALALSRRLELGPGERVLQIISLSFDAAGEEIFPALASGAQLVLYPAAGELSGRAILRFCQRQRITVLHLPTALWQLCVDAAQDSPELLTAPPRAVLVGGESPAPQKLSTWWRLTGGRGTFFQAYGLTEATITSTVDRLTAQMPLDPLRRLPIGLPIENTRILVLDEGQLAPPGGRGELYVSGPGVARGYRNQPEHTVRTFVLLPKELGGGRWCRTGDLVRQAADGRLEFLGRKDEQIKLRGLRLEPGEVAAALVQHPQVREAVVVLRGEGDERQLAAYVVPSLRTANGEQDHVAHWKTIFDETYRRAVPTQEGRFNVIGWNSSYTGRPIPQHEMDLWLAHTVERILALGPRDVLEIGCGTGGILQRVAPHCRSYVATDFSLESIKYVQRQLALCGQAENTALRHQPADDFEGIPPHSFDLVVLNSVVQYFPGPEYLLRVLEGAAHAVRPGGKIFLGDVRNLHLLAALHASVELAQAPDDMPLAELRARVERRIDQEHELLIAPEFFAALCHKLPLITGAEIHLKRGGYLNELNKFRYDVVLHVAGPAPARPACPQMAWPSTPEAGDALRRHLLVKQPDALLLIGVPNARTFFDVRTAELLFAPDAPPNAASLRHALAAEARHVGLDPEVFWQMGEELGEHVHVCWSSRPPAGSVDVLFLRERTAALPGAAPSAASQCGDGPHWPALTNHPLVRAAQRQLVPQLRSWLRERLPSYMMPGAFVVLESLPLDGHGKVDRSALPAPPPGRAAATAAYLPPRTELESQLAALWEDLLGTSPIGVLDNFFDLGGHSLLAVRLAAAVEQQLGRHLPLGAVFEHPTVEQMAALLAAPPPQADSTLVPMRPHGDMRPLFLVHPIGGTVFCYADLLRHLPDNLPVYGLQACGLDGRLPPHETVEEMAAHYVQRLHEVQPHGPYRLGGWSLGGNLAFEMARQLEQAGEHVERLFLIDAGAMAPDRAAAEDDFLPTLLALFPGEDQLSLEELRRLTPEEQLDYFVTRAARAQLVALQDARERARLVFEVFQANLRAMLCYRPGRYAGQVTLFAAEQGPAYKRDPHLGWDAWAAGGIELYTLPADHLQMVRDPYAGTLARLMHQCLE